MRRRPPLFTARDPEPGSFVSPHKNMNRISILVAAPWMRPPTPQAHPPPTEPQKPKPGTIIEQPESGRIVAAPTPSAVPNALAGQRIERFEATGNTSVASD